MQKNKKYCPRCGALIHAGDAYCIRCGYSFKVRQGKKMNLKTIIIAVVVLLIFWIGIRLITKRPIIPNGIIDFFKIMTSNKTG
jgi:predicted nucleic acid-binding Zn ribbon protein